MTEGLGKTLRYTISLTVTLIGIWFLWSGHFEPLMIGLGAIGVATVIFISMRMGIVDDEGDLLGLVPRFPRLGFWLMREIFLSNLKVCTRILHPEIPVQPDIIQVAMSQKSDLGRTIYANSITLTPGTVCVGVIDNQLVVHALSRRSARWLAEGEMDRRVTRAIDGV